MKQSLNLNLSQSLTMTPALQQAIRLLQLSTLDLKTEIQDALDSNVMLEADDDHGEIKTRETPAEERESASGSETIPEDLPVDADWDDIYSGSAAPAPASGSDDADYWDYRQANMTHTPDLHAHVTWQAEMHPFTPRQGEIALHLIDAINAHGLLDEWAELAARLSAEFEVDESDIQAVLDVIQQFDPPGVGARSLAECLMLQIRQLPETTPACALALQLLESEPLDCLATEARAPLAKRLGVTRHALQDAIALIQTLTPHPGDAFSEHESNYVIPEVFVSRQAARWQVALNAEIAPKLRINNEYASLINRSEKNSDQDTLKSHLAEARFFLKSLRSRNETLLAVAQCIVEAQRGFLEYGQEAMKPLVLQDVAGQLDVHESTVSRATANKYMQTPRGIFELKYFFSSHVSTTDGGSASAIAIQAMIKRMVSGECADKPLSDGKIAELLLESGIRVARRTVAKYRDTLSIAPAHERRRQAS